MGLTRKQELVLEFIRNYSKKHGHSPTFEEIKQHFEFKSLGTVYDYVKYLEKAGFINNLGSSRGLEIIDQPESNVNIPLLGDIAAGDPLDIMDNMDHTHFIPFPESSLKKGKHFALQVKGDSMIEDGILDGDIILIRSARTAANGQTVVAVIDNSATVKRYYKNGSSVELKPANRSMKSIILKGGQFKIQGIVVGLKRDY